MSSDIVQPEARKALDIFVGVRNTPEAKPKMHIALICNTNGI